MACFLALVLAATVLTVPTANKLANAARTSPAEAFWRTTLPSAPMPEAIRELLHPRPEATIPNDVKPKDDDDDDPPPMNFKYNDYRAASPRNKAAAPSPEILKHAVAGARNAATDDNAALPTVFFLEDAVRVGDRLLFRRSPRDSTTADTESLAAPLRLYTVRAVRAVVEGSSFVVCRRNDVGAAAVAYGCRATSGNPARAYAVDVAAGGRGGDAVVTAAVVCHMDTPRRGPEHAAFPLLGVKPGGAAVCHAVPGAQLLAAEKDEVPVSP